MDGRMSDVDYALQILREETQALLNDVRKRGASAYVAGDHDTFREIDSQRQSLERFSHDVEALWAGWQSLFEEEAREQQKRTSEGRVSPDSILEERTYVFPILEILTDAGGTVQVDHVLQRLDAMIGHRLTPLDRAPISNGGMRWHNRAHWVRRYMVLAGMLRADSPRGKWQITDEGRRALAQQDIDETWRVLMDAKKNS
jgi:hypothetical protein